MSLEVTRHKAMGEALLICSGRNHKVRGSGDPLIGLLTFCRLHGKCRLGRPARRRFVYDEAPDNPPLAVLAFS
jgi:hypothetical protein